MEKLKAEIIDLLKRGEQLRISNNEICEDIHIRNRSLLVPSKAVAAEYKRLKEAGHKIDLVNYIEKLRDNAKSIKLYSLVYSDGVNIEHIICRDRERLHYEISNEKADEILKGYGYNPEGMHDNKKKNLLAFIYEDLFDVRVSQEVQGYYVPDIKKEKNGSGWVITVGCVVNEKGEIV